MSAYVNGSRIHSFGDEPQVTEATVVATTTSGVYVDDRPRAKPKTSSKYNYSAFLKRRKRR